MELTLVTAVADKVDFYIYEASIKWIKPPHLVSR